jgi:hypothetical protein
MASGYLGKISAIVSANTADFDGKLSKSAKEVSTFARGVQSNLTSASRQAAKSLEGIYTPLQRFERSLQAAASMKLSFKGFPGMIKDLDGLQQRLNSVLSQRQVDIVLKTTGMSSVSALRDAISGLKSKDIEIITRFGGVDKLNELGGKILADVDIGKSRETLASLTAAAEAAKAKVLAISSGAVTVTVNAESLDSLRAKADEARAAAGKLMGGEFMGDKSLAKSISSTSSELVKLQSELDRATAARNTLATMASGPKSKPEELNAANARVSSLTGQQQELAKKLADLEKYRDTIKTVMRDIKQAEAGGGAAAGGGDIAAARKEEAAATRAVSQATKDLQNQLATRFGVDIDLANLEKLIERANTAGGVVNNLDALIENLGKSDFDAAADSMRKLQSASSQIFEPLAASVKKLAGLGVEFQTPFHEALKSTQADVERLKVAIDAVGENGPNPELLAFFAEVQAKSNGATKAIDRFVEVSDRLGQLKTGREFAFEQPGLNEAINKSGDIGNRAAALPAETLRTNPAIAQSLVDIRRLSDEAGVAYARFLAVKDQKQPTGEAQKELDATVGRLIEAQAASERLIASSKLRADEAAREAVEIGVSLASLQSAGAVAGQYAAARRLVADEAAREATEIGVSLASLQAAGAVAGQYAAARRIVADEAAREAVEIGVSLDALKKSASIIPRRSDLYDNRRAEVRLAVTGTFANADQIEAEVSRVTADIQKLEETQKAAFGDRAMLVIDLLGANKIQEAATAAASLRAELEKQIEVNVTTAAAQKAVDDLKAKMAQAREQTAFLVTGRPQNIQQADSRRASIDADVATLDRSQRQNVKPLLEAADAARATGDIDKVNDALDDLALRVAQEKRINVTATEAKKNIDDLKAKMDSLRDESNFVISAKVQNAGQAEAEIKRIIGGMEQLDAAQRQALQPKVDAAISSLGMKDAKTGLSDIAAISAAVKDLSDAAENELVIKVNKDKAQKSVEELKSSLASIADKIGEPSEPIDRLRKAVEAANAAIAKMPAGALKTKLQGDLNSAKVSIEAASKPGSPVATAKGIDSAATSINAIAAAATAATPAKATANPLGADFGTAERSIASLQSNVSSLQNSLEKLPLPMQAQFIPAINEVRSEFQKLTLASTSDEIDAVVTKAKTLEGAFTRAGQAAKFGGTLGEALNEAAITRTEKRLGFVKAKLLEVGASASGPVANAFNRYSAAAAAAAQAGTSGTAATTKMLDGLIAKIGQALVAEGKLTAAQGKAFSKNVGDVGRGGADKFSLALNQAAFAVDDFMSSTGGLEFKLRAVSNNITQLAFVLGGTTGLFVGLGAVIAGQVAVGLIKWANSGRSAEDQTKALNDSLARQKSLVEELAQAFGSLGDAVSRSTLSAGGDSGRQFGQGVSDIRRKQRELREERVAATDAGFQTNAANISRDKKQLETETDQGVRVGLARRIQQAEAVNRDLPGVLANRAPQLPSAPSIGVRNGTGEINGVGQLREVLFQEVLRNIPQTRRTTTGREAIPQEERERRAREMTAGVDESPSSQRNVIEKLIGQLQPQADRGEFGFGETVRRLQSLLDQLESPFQKAIDDMALKVASASEEAARFIRTSQEDVADAIGRGVPGAARFQQELDSLASELTAANAKLARSVEMAAATSDPAKRESIVKEAEKEVAGVRAKQAETEAKAREIRLGRSIGGERLTQATAAMEGNERFRNERAGLIAGGRAAADAELVARRRVEQNTASVGDNQQQLRDARAEQQKVRDSGGDSTAVDASVKKAEADLKAAQAAAQAAGQNLELAQRASEAAAALADAALSIESALSRVRKVGDSALQRSEQGADAAQQDYTNSPLRAGAKEARDAAERRLINDRARVGNAQAGLDNRRREIQQDPAVQKITREMESIKQRREDLTAKSQTAGGLNAAENKELTAATQRYIELVRQLEQAALGLTDADRKQQDIINLGIAAREKELAALRQKAEQDPSFDRRREAAGQIADAGRRQADEAQQRFINDPTDKNRQERDAADRRLREDRMRADGLQDSLDAKRKEIQQDPRVVAIDKQTQANNERLAALAEKEATVGLTRQELEDRKNLNAANNIMRGRRDEIVDIGTRGEQKAIDDAQIAQNQRDRAIRGRDLGLTDTERFRKDFAEGAGADINARAKEMRGNGEDPTKFLRQAVANQLESAAPMLKQLQEERRNALLQGPSRAALTVSDVSTTQGQSELNRLLRGDDSAKNVNLAELRKQTAKFDALIEAVKAANPGVLL